MEYVGDIICEIIFFKHLLIILCYKSILNALDHFYDKKNN
jgi:hypothetical protein